MTKQNWFLVTSTALAIATGIICFKNLRNLRKSLYWTIFPDIISIWSKKTWAKDFENSFRFEAYITLVAVLIGINYLVFKYVL